MFYQLPPVGDRVITSKKCDSKQVAFIFEENTRFYQSGTAALCSAITAAKTANHCQQPEVILPAYGCPDLVSASIYAGVKPVLVDLEEDRPWLNLSLLENSITQNTVAIVAVNLFGIAERWQPLGVLAKKHGLVLIEDSAQYFPGTEQPDWGGDLVVFSFGRGKPVSLLGGGAVLCRDASLSDFLISPELTAISVYDKFSFILKASLYNAMISPYLYWLPQSLPFLHLGETRYHKLDEIMAMDLQRLELLMSNIVQYENHDYSTDCRKIIGRILNHANGVINLPEICGTDNHRRLLRYPLLIDPAARAGLHHDLNKAGLGVSVMYPANMANLPGLEHIFEGKQKFPNAEQFAAMILTISVKSCVSDKNVKKLGDVFSRWF